MLDGHEHFSLRPLAGASVLQLPLPRRYESLASRGYHCLLLPVAGHIRALWRCADHTEHLTAATRCLEPARLPADWCCGRCSQHVCGGFCPQVSVRVRVGQWCDPVINSTTPSQVIIVDRWIPIGVATDASHVYVTSSGISVGGAGYVFVFSLSNGVVSSSETQLISAYSGIWSPFGVTTDASNVYVVGSSNNGGSLCVFPRSNAPALPSPSQVISSSSMVEPYGVAVDGTNVYVADHVAGRVYVFSLSNGVVSTSPIQTLTTPALSYGAWVPERIAVDSTSVYVSQAFSCRRCW